MRLAFILSFLLCVLVAPFGTTAHASSAQNNYDALFSPNTVWLNTSRPLSADDAKGRAVLLDFWTYGCINCMQIVPDLKALEAHFGDRLLIIGVHSAKFTGERANKRIEAAAKRFGLAHPVINDSDFRIWKHFEVNAWPTLVLLDTQGNVVSTYAGEGHKSALEKDIAEILARTPAAKNTVPLSSLEMKDAKNGMLSFPARLGFAKATPWGDLIFAADSGHNRLVGFTPTGDIKVIIGSGAQGDADGDFSHATFNNPRGFGVAKGGLYVADTGNHLIRFVDFSKKTVTRAAGTGTQGYDTVTNAPALQTPLASPWDAKMMQDGTTLAIAMAGLHQIWTLDTRTGKISTAAGSGREGLEDDDAQDAALAQPSGLSVLGGTLYFVDAESSSLRALTPDGEVKTLIGAGLFDFGLADGTAQAARLQHAQGLYALPDRILVADTYNNALRIYTFADKKLTTLKLPANALAEPGDVLPLDGKIYVADTDDNAVKVVDEKTGDVTTLSLKQDKAR